MVAKTKKPPTSAGRLPNNALVLADCDYSVAHSVVKLNEKLVILDRERIRDGFRKGQPTAAFLLIIDDRVAWRGFSRATALEAAKVWTDRGARLVDRCEEGAR